MSSATRAVTCVFAVYAALARPSPSASATPPDASLAQLAERYRQGYRDGAVGAIGSWTAERTRREVDALLQARPFDPALAFAAALLHVHRALLESSTTSLEYRGQHLDAATRLVLAAADTPSTAGLARRMFLLVGLAREETLDVAAANEIARAGLQRFEGDGELLAVLGTTLEAARGMRTYELPPDPKRRSSADEEPGYTVEGAGSRGERRAFPRGTLGEAEAAFRRALAADPALGEARLRLGRVKVLQGRPGEALVELERVASGDVSPRRLYLAHLFAARAHEKGGKLESAARAYRAAVAIEPGGQSAWLGLGRALEVLGQHDEAQRAFVAALSTRGKRADPWWSYPRGDVDRVEPLVRELQESLAR